MGRTGMRWRYGAGTGFGDAGGVARGCSRLALSRSAQVRGTLPVPDGWAEAAASPTSTTAAPLKGRPCLTFRSGISDNPPFRIDLPLSNERRSGHVHAMLVEQPLELVEP